MTGLNDDFLMAGTQPHDADRKLFVKFSLEPRLDKAATVEAGRNMYRDVEFISIHIPGDKLSAVHRPVAPSDKQRFPMQYQAFRNNKGDQIVGTPLSLWPAISPARVKELEFFNIQTVEQLASMPDSNAGQLMGIQALKIAAKQYITAAKDAAPLMAVQHELKARDGEIAALKEAMDTQGKQIAALLAALPQPEAAAKKGK